MSTLNNLYSPPIAFHPGETLEEKLQEMEMGPKEFAVRTGKPEKTVIAILKGTSSITPEMAVLFENVLKIPAHFWLNMQRNYDEYKARMEREQILTESTDWAKKFPIKDMVAKGMISRVSTIREKTSALLDFFRVSSHHAWEDYYFNKELKVRFRISLAHTNEPYAISAWLRQGELQAAAMTAHPFNPQLFKESLAEIKQIATKHPNGFFKKLQAICLKSGVKVVHTPCINKAPINGSARWINDTPIIQLSGRYNRNDIFWFTFFHEAGHILLHGKKDIFLEDVEYSEKDKQKEKEADEFAIKWTLTHEQEAEIVERMPISEDDVIKFAKRFNTHPAMIIGRLHHKKLMPHTFGNKLLEPLKLE